MARYGSSIRNRLGPDQGDRAGSRARRVASTLATLLALQLLLIPLVARATASTEAAAGDKKCLMCHGRTLNRTLENGATRSLHVDAEGFASSVHARLGCAGCHKDIAGSRHPSKEPLEEERAFSVEANGVCRKCHPKQFRQYGESIHASLVAEGNPKAPVCSDCHSAHAVQPVATFESGPATGLPCRNCHQDIFDAYAHSVHGKARTQALAVAAGQMQAPVCMDCHQAHHISAVAAGERLQATCLDCHKGAPMAHQAWLPNPGLHMDVVACPVCHSPAAQRKIDLELYDLTAQSPVGEDGKYAGLDERMRAITATGKKLSSQDLQQLIRQSRQDGRTDEVTLRGHMQVRTGPEAHELTLSKQAVRNCESCHRQGAEAFADVTVSITGPDGRKRYYPASQDVLTSVASVDSVGRFYAMGGTRIKLLDTLVALALVGGLAIPLGHMTLGKYLHRKPSVENDNATDSSNSDDSC